MIFIQYMADIFDICVTGFRLLNILLPSCFYTTNVLYQHPGTWGCLLVRSAKFVIMAPTVIIVLRPINGKQITCDHLTLKVTANTVMLSF